MHPNARRHGSWSTVSSLLVALVGCATGDLGDSTSEGEGKVDTIGPGANAGVAFHSPKQKGGVWELGNGELYTAFQTGYQFIDGGRTRYDFKFALVQPEDAAQRDATLLGSAGGCTDVSGWNYACGGGLLTPTSQKDRSIVSHDDRILTATTLVAGRDYRPRLMLTDPQGGPTVVFADFPTMTSTLSTGQTTASRTIEYRLQRLPDGNIVFSAAVDGGVADRSFVLDDSGAILGEVDGYVMSYRANPLELLVLRKLTRTEHAYVWWNPASQATSHAADIPAARTNVLPVRHRPVVTHDRGLVLWPISEDRVIRFRPDGTLDRDEVLPTSSRLKGVSPTGDALIWELTSTAGVRDWSLVLAEADGSEQVVYTKARLRTDTSWNLSESSFTYPFLDGIYTPVFDDAGNVYVPFVQAAGGDTRTKTFMVGFAAEGEELFGIELGTMYGGRCLPHSVLPSSRLAVLCERRIANELYVLGE